MMRKISKKKPTAKTKKTKSPVAGIEQEITVLKAQGYDCGGQIEKHQIGIRQQQTDLGQISAKLKQLYIKLRK